MTKAIGSEIVDFYNNGWPDGYYSDDSELSVTDDGQIVREDGDSNSGSLPLTDKYDLVRFGWIFSEKGLEARNFSYFFNKWKKAKTTMTLVIEISKDKEQAVRDLLAAADIKVK